jgi:hypothetical protein
MNTNSKSSKSILASPWVYFAVAYGWIWTFWLLTAQLGISLNTASGVGLLMLSLCGPAVSGVGLTYLTRDKIGRRDYWQHVIDTSRISARWYVLMIFLILMISSLGCAQTTISNKTNYEKSLDTNLQDSFFNPRNDDIQEKITTCGKGYRLNKNGWIYIHIEGSPYERGFQNGYLTASEIEKIMKSCNYLVYWNTGKEWKFFVDAGEQILATHVDQEYLEELKGIADGAKAAGVNTTWQEILAWNAYYELVYSWWPNEKEGKITPAVKEKDHCSAFIATGNATEDGRIVMAHNTWLPYEVGQFSNLIVDLVPEKGNHIFMQSSPGYIDSRTDFFISDAGLMGTETAIIGFAPYDLNGIPDFARSRKAMQYADSLDQFAEIMVEGNNGGSADSWLVGDAKTGEIMSLELGLEYYNITKSKDGYFIGFNAPSDPRIRNLECSNTGFGDIRRSSGARQVRLTQLMEDYHGKINCSDAKAILADHYDIYLKKINPSSRTVDGHCELDPMEYSDPAWGLPFQPLGTVDGMVTNSTMTENLSFWARWGSSAGMPFNASQFLEEHIQWRYLKGYLRDQPSQPWTQFNAGEIKP